jgi:Cu2+-exporting ATPase
MYAQVIEQPLAAPACFHCGLPVPWGSRYVAQIDRVERAMCCPGCCAVAEAIVEAGLADYYRYRTAAANPQRATSALDQLRLFDLPEVQQTFVRAVSESVKEAALILDDITCAACVWLIEKRVGALPGVTNLEVNYATRRARVAWDSTRIRLSEILDAVAAIGYRAQPFDADRSDQMHRRETRAMLLRLSVAALGMMQVMMYASTLYFAQGDMTRDIENLMRWVSLVLTTPVVFYSAGPFFRSAWRDLRSWRVGMDVPVALGVGVAFAASVWATFRDVGEVYYDSIAMFVFLLLLARFLESVARAKAVQGVEQLAKLVPAVAERVPDFPASRATEQVAVARLVPGDHVLVRAGSSIPADGRIVEGVSRVDEALLTGESRPMAKRAGDSLIGGALNVASPLLMRVERVGQQTVLATIVRLLDRAMTEKPRIAQLADRVAQRFLSALLFTAAVVAAIWTLIEPSQALWITVSVLVVACPCALSLAMPAALTAATGNLARHGVLVTRGHTLEALAQATHFVFDKTGTLTRGRFQLTGVHTLGAMTREQCLASAAVLEFASEHPIARALRDAAVRCTLVYAVDVVNTPGAGVEGRIDNRRMRIGTPAFVAELAGDVPSSLLGQVAAGASAVAMGAECLDNHPGWLALFTFGDPIRDDAHSVIRALLDRGKAVSVLSGDRPEVAQHVARELGIAHVVAGATPQDKLGYVLRLQAAGEKVAMIGDGVNDAPVLAAATVSVAMGCSTDVARASADAVLMTDRLQSLVDSVVEAVRTRRVIKQNLGWAIAYNLTALPLAAFGYVTPWMAGLGMAISSLLVVANALRLARPASRPSKGEG